jgi:glycosyltransferase involved in cell wall biosynthesis
VSVSLKSGSGTSASAADTVSPSLEERQPARSPSSASAVSDKQGSPDDVHQRQTPAPRRVLLITNIPTPYRIPLFNELNAQLAKEGIAFKVIFAALGYPRRKWAIDMAHCSFAWEVLNSGRVPSRNPEKAMFTYSGLGRVLRAEKDALIILGGFSLATTRVWLRSFLGRTRYLIWSGAIERKGRTDSILQRWQRRLLVSRACGFIAYGTRARDYLVSLGADPARTSIGINTVDCAYFRQEASSLRPEFRPHEPKRILYVGNLEPGKRVDHLLKAAHLLAKRRSDFVVEIVGTGSQEQSLKKLACDLGIAGRVRFFGFLQRTEIANRLAHACCFAFPSEYDVWGLVLVEAMAAGVPCVSSIHSGATCDLIRDQDTGYSVDFSDERKVADALACLIENPREACDMGARASRFISDQVSLSRSAAGFLNAIRGVFLDNAR